LGDSTVSSITLYDNEIPKFAKATLERLYENVYCTLPRIAAYETVKGISTYVRRIGEKIVAIILFRDLGSKIAVVNQQISLTQSEILSFCHAVFAKYRKAQAISFYALDTRIEDFPLPFQQTGALEENIIYFSKTKEMYLASIRPAFLKKLNKSAELIRADHPTYKISYFARTQIKKAHVEDVLELAKKRMISKGKQNYTDSIDIVPLMATLRSYGHLVVATIDDKVCAGSISCKVGQRNFHQVAAHDPAYDRYELGNQIWLAAILHSFDLNGSECWLMGGKSEQKSKFRARQHILNTIIVYRSRFHVFLNCKTFLDLWLRQKNANIKPRLKVMADRLQGKAPSVIRFLRNTHAWKTTPPRSNPADED
jgi:hypothetical protein